MMDKYEDFKQSYVKYFIEDSNFCVSHMITTLGDIPSSNNYKEVAARACALLSDFSTRDSSHLKLLPTYNQYIETNKAYGMKTSDIEFALMLYLLHYFTLRIARGPWRKEYLTVKAYNGFYRHTLCQYLAPAVTEHLMAQMGFVYNKHHDTFEYSGMNDNHLLAQEFIDYGLDFFLSFTHCRMRVDPSYWNEYKKHLPRTTNIIPQYTDEMLQSRWRTEDSRNNGNRSRDISNTWNASSKSRSMLQESPLDLSLNESDKRLYDGFKTMPRNEQILQNKHPDSKATRGTNNYSSSYSPTHGRHHDSREAVLPENSINGRVLYPPNMNERSTLSSKSTGQSRRGLDADLEPWSSTRSLNRQSDRRPTNQPRGEQQSGTYVKVFPPRFGSEQRGSPDGQMNEEKHSDPDALIGNNLKSQDFRSKHQPVRHVYEEISDTDLY